MSKKNLVSSTDFPPLEPLIPSSRADPHGTYQREIEHAIQNKDVNNIAITGHYGSGKSSVLKAFKDKYDKSDTVLEVSLANFDSKKLDKEGAELEIEKSILQQIFYQVDPNSIPLSGLKRITTMDDNSKLKTSIFTVLYILLGFAAFKSNPIAELINIPHIGFTLIALFSLVSCIVLYKVIERLRNIKLNKVVIQDTELDLSHDKDSSFNQHIDEILYLFSSTNYEVLILEDLDRANKINIFEKLRELNTLINKAQSIAQNITFIYAVRDSLFIGEERTKFFDLIIPVIPHINAAGNARDKLSKKFKEYGLEDQISSDLLTEISLFIHDTRLLTNIINEFNIYWREMLANKSIYSNDAQKLFCLILYKNFFPNDFEALHQGKGWVTSVFNNHLKTSKQKKLTKLETEIENKRVEIDEAKLEILHDTTELRAALLNSILDDLSTLENLKLQINGANYTCGQIIKDVTLFEAMIQQNIVRVSSHNSSHGNKAISDHIKESYLHRKTVIHNKSSTRLEALKTEYSKLINEKNNLTHLSLEQFIAQYGIDDLFKDNYMLYATLKPEKPENIPDYTNESEVKLLTLLLRNGYISKDHSRYISYIHEGGVLTWHEQEFIRKIILQEKTEQDIQLSNPLRVIKDIPLKYFGYPEILNYEIVNTLLTSDDKKIDKKRVQMVDMLISESKLMKKFIPEYLQWGDSEAVHKLVHDLASSSDKFWSNIKTINDNDVLSQVMILMFMHNDLETIEKQGKSLSDFIFSEAEDLLVLMSVYEFDTTTFKNYLARSTPYTFSNLQDPIAQAGIELLSFICETKIYKINNDMIALMLKYLCPDEDRRRLNISMTDEKILTYSNICASGIKCLTDHIDVGIDTYTNDVYIPIIKEDSSSEDKDSTIQLFKHDELTKDNKIALLNATSIIFSDLYEIPDEFHLELYKQNKIKPTWNNLVKLYLHEDSSPELITSYLQNDRVFDELNKQDFSVIAEEYGHDISDKLLLSIFFDYDVDDNWLQLAYKYNGPINLSAEKDYTDKKIKHLIEMNFVQVSPENYGLIRNMYTEEGYHLLLVCNDFNSFLKELTKYTISKKDICKILELDRLPYILRAKLIVRYSIETFSSEEIIPLASKVIAEVVSDTDLSITPEQILVIFTSEMETIKKLELLSLNIGKFNIEKAKEAMILLGGKYKRLMPPSSGGNESFTMNPINTKLFNALKGLKLVGVINETGKTITVNKKKKMPA